MITGLVHMIRLKRRMMRLAADQRGAASFELLIVYPVLLIGVMMPLADVGVASFQYISARQALRAFGQTIQYSPPSDFSSTSAWESAALAKADPNYPIDDIAIMCGTSACSATNSAMPRYYSYTTTFTLTPLVLSSVLCSSSCTVTLPYSERFY